MTWLIWAGVLPLCLIVTFLLLQRPIRLFLEDLHVDQARESFHLQREWLEARFVTALERADPGEAARWEEARWRDEVLWARDRQSRCLLALVCVHFQVGPFDHGRVATAVFEYRKRRWCADGKRLDEIRPDQVVGRNRPYEPVEVVQPSARRVV